MQTPPPTVAFFSFSEPLVRERTAVCRYAMHDLASIGRGPRPVNDPVSSFFFCWPVAESCVE